jgi:hypothetical protein
MVRTSRKTERRRNKGIRRTSSRILRSRKRKRSISKKLKGGYLESKINKLEDVAEKADTDNDGILNPSLDPLCKQSSQIFSQHPS